MHRGVMWGSLEITSADQEYCWTVHGLPWRQCKQFAAILLDAYRNWAQGRVEKLDDVLPDMLHRIDEFIGQTTYLRQSEHHNLNQFLQHSLAMTGLSHELATSFRPMAFEKVTPWLEDNADWLKRPINNGCIRKLKSGLPGLINSSHPR